MKRECISVPIKGVEANNCFCNTATYAEGSIYTYMKLTLFRVGDTKMKKEIIILANSEYTITFYNPSTNSNHTVTGLVTNVYGEGNSNQYLIFKYKTAKQSDFVTYTYSRRCGCYNDDPSNNTTVSEEKVETIPIQNIYDIQYGSNNPLYCNCNNEPENSSRGGYVTVLLGIDAEIVKAITVNLKLLDDQSDNAIHLIELKKDNVYELSYCSPKDGSIYEITGKLTELEAIETDNVIGGPEDFVHCCFQMPPNENVGIAGSIYTSSGYQCDIDKFLSQSGPYKEVRLIFDTSTNNSGTYEIVALSWIRSIKDVTPVGDPVRPGESDCCNDCANNILNKGIIIYYNFDGRMLKYYPLSKQMVIVNRDGKEDVLKLHEYEPNFNHIFDTDDCPISPKPGEEVPIAPPPIGEVEVTPEEDDW